MSVISIRLKEQKTFDSIFKQYLASSLASPTLKRNILLDKLHKAARTYQTSEPYRFRYFHGSDRAERLSEVERRFNIYPISTLSYGESTHGDADFGENWRKFNRTIHESREIGSYRYLVQPNFQLIIALEDEPFGGRKPHECRYVKKHIPQHLELANIPTGENGGQGTCLIGGNLFVNQAGQIIGINNKTGDFSDSFAQNTETLSIENIVFLLQILCHFPDKLADQIMIEELAVINGTDTYIRTFISKNDILNFRQYSRPEYAQQIFEIQTIYKNTPRNTNNAAHTATTRAHQGGPAAIPRCIINNDLMGGSLGSLGSLGPLGAPTTATGTLGDITNQGAFSNARGTLSQGTTSPSKVWRPSALATPQQLSQPTPEEKERWANCRTP